MKFTIRDLLWLTVVVALVVGWWAERRGKDLLHKELAKSSQDNEILVRFLKAQDIHMTIGVNGGMQFGGDGLKWPEELKGLPEETDESDAQP